MALYELTDLQIKDLAVNQIIYNQGIGSYVLGAVKNFTFDPNKRMITATVSEVRSHGVQVIFNSDGSLKFFDCTCALFENYPVACRHIVAVLKSTQGKMDAIRPPP